MPSIIACIESMHVLQSKIACIKVFVIATGSFITRYYLVSFVMPHCANVVSTNVPVLW